MSQQPVYGTVANQPHPPQFQWSTGLFNCTDDGDGCIEGWCCLHCQLARQYNMLNYNSRDIHPGVCVISVLVDSCTATNLGVFLLSWMIRNQLMQRLRVYSDPFNEAVITCCCTPCSACQTYKELTVRGMWPGGCCIDKPPLVVPIVPVMGDLNPQQPLMGVEQQQQQQQQQPYKQI